MNYLAFELDGDIDGQHQAEVIANALFFYRWMIQYQTGHLSKNPLESSYMRWIKNEAAKDDIEWELDHAWQMLAQMREQDDEATSFLHMSGVFEPITDD